MKKNDWILAGIILAGALIASLLHSIGGQKNVKSVTVRVDDKLYGIYDLQEEQVVTINGTNTLSIKDQKVKMLHADCPDQLCVHQHAINKNRESIICLPNKVVVVMESRQESELDAVSQ